MPGVLWVLHSVLVGVILGFEATFQIISSGGQGSGVQLTWRRRYSPDVPIDPLKESSKSGRAR